MTGSGDGCSLGGDDADEGECEGSLDNGKSVGSFEGLLEVGLLVVGLLEGLEVGSLVVGFPEGDDVGLFVTTILVVTTLNVCSSSDGTLLQ